VVHTCAVWLWERACHTQAISAVFRQFHLLSSKISTRLPCPYPWVLSVYYCYQVLLSAIYYPGCHYCYWDVSQTFHCNFLESSHVFCGHHYCICYFTRLGLCVTACCSFIRQQCIACMLRVVVAGVNGYIVYIVSFTEVKWLLSFVCQ